MLIETNILNNKPMKKLILLIAAVVIGHTTVFSQGCLPEGITITSQAQIDSFQINYPGCTEIEGDVMIGGMFHDITNLLGLSVLTTIGGNLKIQTVWELHSLAGLENLSYIGGDLSINNNDSLTSLTGLDNLTSIGGDLLIGDGYGINDEGNDSLTSLTGVGNLSSIGGCLRIEGNDYLENISGLSTITSVGGCIGILGNYSLISLSGLDNIIASSVTDLNISHNSALSTCNVQSICNYLASPNGIVDIYDNAPGCNNPLEIASLCGISLPCLPFGNYYFYTQADLDNFQTNYPGCTSLQGYVSIVGDDIVNLNGFNVVASFENELHITNNPLLVNLSGLDSVEYVGDKFYINNNLNLTSLTALAKLNYVGSELYIGYNKVLPSLSGLENMVTIGSDVYFVGNDKLTSLTGLASLDSIGGSLTIAWNKILTSLAGMENLHSESIYRLDIHNNQLLSTCNVQSVCDYLAAPNAGVWIYSNATGCNSALEVIAACTVGTSYMEATENHIALYPNPATDQITLESPVAGQVTILNLGGQKLIQKEIIGQTTNLDISNLPKGVYFVHFVGVQNVWAYKFWLKK